MKRRTIFKVLKRDNKWFIKTNKCVWGWTLDGPFTSKAKTIDSAFAYAKKIKNSIVRIFDYKNRLQVEVDSKTL